MICTQARGRFDDLPADMSWEFPEVIAELVATRQEDVVPVLDDVEQACSAGWWAIGFIAYEAAAGLDPDLPVGKPVEGLPLVWFGICRPPHIGIAIARQARAGYTVAGWRTQWSQDCHRSRVNTVREHIAAGETYQCNLTTRLVGTGFGEMQSFYADLALAQRGAYNAYLDIGQLVVASASPELFFEVRGRQIQMRPMKGTARRGTTLEEDALLVSALRTSPKERAENSMIVDLVRNDISRLAETGSVSVTDLCRIEHYETVHQLTSGVTARLRPRTSLSEVLRALFPCGSVTGVPKIRTMQLIRELEDGPRGVYCGAVGMVAPPDTAFQARFNVAIRTAVFSKDTRQVTYGTGGGITWDSDPAAEYAELLAKAELLHRCSLADSEIR